MSSSGRRRSDIQPHHVFPCSGVFSEEITVFWRVFKNTTDRRSNEKICLVVVGHAQKEGFVA